MEEVIMIQQNVSKIHVNVIQHLVNNAFILISLEKLFMKGINCELN